MKPLKYLLPLILLAGTTFAWYTVFTDFIKFYAAEGTILKVADCVIPNPVTTPCFYGAFAFLGAFIWSLIILGFGEIKQKKHYLFLRWFLVASNIFAWTNFCIILSRFIRAHGAPAIGCSGQITANPLNTPCFIGSMIFALALINVAVIVWKYKHLKIKI